MVAFPFWVEVPEEGNALLWQLHSHDTRLNAPAMPAHSGNPRTISSIPRDFPVATAEPDPSGPAPSAPTVMPTSSSSAPPTPQPSPPLAGCANSIALLPAPSCSVAFNPLVFS